MFSVDDVLIIAELMALFILFND
jgi:hypothetical protein